MSTKEIAKTWLRNRVHNFVGANIRQWKWTSYVGEIAHNTLGGIVELNPIEGKVVDIADGFVLLKVTANTFHVTSESLLTQPVDVGDKVKFEFYQRRRFDGLKADGSEDPAKDGFVSFMLTGTKTYFPATWEGRYIHNQERHPFEYTTINNPYLRDLIEQMEVMPVDGGRRCAINVLIDAGGKNLRFVDPSEDSAEKPAIVCEISNTKTEGTATVQYDRASDTYEVVFACPGYPDTLIQDIYFDGLGDVLKDLIDDGTWAQAKVTILKAAPKKKQAAASAASAPLDTLF